eukprot:CAMPEP_0194284020 /NCGR_PEP_ID=MMETSP0169-20130528/26571_1 /TAXON_ID=218684 /ORGANISM="Corethron pennatum, Strain L29A3" /LENGTH=120 /DNA_ID=CAMNT_0039029741 /DNA_START=580 /DNA_END=939 /DNA_ORIENTATION=+
MSYYPQYQQFDRQQQQQARNGGHVNAPYGNGAAPGVPNPNVGNPPSDAHRAPDPRQHGYGIGGRVPLGPSHLGPPKRPPHDTGGRGGGYRPPHDNPHLAQGYGADASLGRDYQHYWQQLV